MATPKNRQSIPVVKAASGRSGSVTQPSADNQENKSMSTTKTPNSNQKPNKPSTPPPPAPADAAKSADGKEKKEPKRPRVRWVSPKDPTFWVRSYKDVTDKHGAPKDPWGNTMEAKAGGGGGGANLKAAREAEKAKMAAMTDEQKLAYAKTKREEKAAAKAAKKLAERNALIEQLKKEIAEGKI